jgi:beta-lactam-binding protein with PASTA domain
VTETPPESWPTPEGETVVRDDTVVAGGPPPPVGPPPDRRIGSGMLLGLGAIALVAAGIAIAWYLTHRDSQKQVTTTILTTTAKAPVAQKVSVPRVVGMKEQDALVRLAQIGLRPKEVYRPTTQAKGVVVSQKPQEATEVKKGTQVTLVIDSGAPKFAVPTVTGGTVTDAQTKLDALGLNSSVTQVTSTQPAGTVVDQAPKPGAQIAKGSTITLSVAKAPAQTTSTPTTTSAPTTTSSATTTAPPQTTTAAAPPQPQTATMPDVTSQTEAAAAQAMFQAGIIPSLFFVPGTDPLGSVEQQAKPAGTKLPYHAHVQVNLSSGPGDKPKQEVPNVVGQQLQQAVSAIQAAHLRLIYLKYPVTSKSTAGEIVQQTPLGGNQAPQNAQVLVFLAVYRQ